MYAVQNTQQFSIYRRCRRIDVYIYVVLFLIFVLHDQKCVHCALKEVLFIFVFTFFSFICIFNHCQLLELKKILPYDII